jgi:pyruvate dehydrogenase E1 component beta subunit
LLLDVNASTATTYFTIAIRDAIAAAMAEDPHVIVLGEDVERSTIGATRGLLEQFGSDRVRNTPISEAGFVGASAGAAMRGLRPVVDLAFSSFLYVAMDQIANQIGRLRYMSGGQVGLPLVIFAGSGPAGSAAAQHSENPHAVLMHLAGVKVVYPSDARDAKGLMLTSIRDPDPVVYLFDFVLAGSKGAVPSEPYGIPLGAAERKREGKDATIVALGSSVHLAVAAADEIAASGGPSVEVLDPRTLVPFDWESVMNSARKTGRLVVVDPARRTCGAAAEICCRAAEELWGDLTVPPRRVTWPDVPVPFSPDLEEAVLVTKERILDAIEK